MDQKELQSIIRAVIHASLKPMTFEEICQLFTDCEEVKILDIKDALSSLLKKTDPVLELKQVPGGYRYYIRNTYVPWIQKSQNTEAKTENLSRALLETLAIIAYKQPVSRGEVDYIRGKTTTADLFEQLEERGWIKIVTHDEDGRTALFGTTLEFLEYFGLNDIQDLPELPELKELCVNAEEIHI